MGLQRFKLNIANTVINEENAGGGLRSMGHEELLELFQPAKSTSSRKRQRADGEDDKGNDGDRHGPDGADRRNSKKVATVAGAWSGLPQSLVDRLEAPTEEYEQELDFGRFVDRMSKQ